MTIPLKIINKKDMKEIPRQSSAWNKIAENWEVYVVKKIPFVEEFLEGKKGKVVDFACGNGRNMIKNLNIEYYGIDFSEQMIKNAEKYVRKDKVNAKLFQSRVDKLDKKIFKDNMFDYGLFMAALHCLESERERLNSLKEFYRILKPKAEALISVWLSEDPRFKGKDKEVYMSWKKKGKTIMRYYYLYDKQ